MLYRRKKGRKVLGGFWGAVFGEAKNVDRAEASIEPRPPPLL